MIETYKIVYSIGKYSPLVALTMNKGSSYITRGNDEDHRNHMRNMFSENIVSQIVVNVE